jgi:hypothetical protein
MMKGATGDAKSEEDVTSVPRKGVDGVVDEGPSVPRKGVAAGTLRSTPVLEN